LPRRLRNEVGLELRALLTDALHSAATDAGRDPDRELTLEVLRTFGRPDVVASRYAPRTFTIIEPELAPWFLTLSVACVAIQWTLTLPRVFTSAVTIGDWWLGWGFGALWWIGLLTVWFGAAGWVQRRSPLDAHRFVRPWTHYVFWVPFARDWLPPDKEEDIQYGGNAGGHVVRLLVPTLVVTFFVSPVWFLNFFVPAGVDTSWARYDAAFQRGLLAPLIALMGVRLALFGLAVANQRWRDRSEPLRFGLWALFIGALIWALLGWDIFASPTTDVLFKAWLSIFVLVNSIVLVVFMRRAFMRIRIPTAFYPALHDGDKR
jgi:hypothetical protein